MAPLRNLNFIVLIFSLGTTFSACAEDRKTDCYRFQNSLEISSCFERELNEADDGLNKTYQSILKKINQIGDRDPLIASLKRAQREWVTYRDLNCKFYSEIYSGGSAVGTEFVACKARMTKERLTELSDKLKYFHDKFE